MHPQVNVLVKLQDLDLSIGMIEEGKENYPQKIQLLMEKLEEERGLTDLEKDRFKELQRNRRQEEMMLETEIQRIAKSEEKLLLVKTNKEYQAALKEIALAKESNSEREEKVLNILEKLDVLGREVGKRERDFDAMSKKFNKEKSELKKKLKGFERQLAEKTEDREKLLPQIEPKMLQLYEKIKKGRQGIAIVPARDGFCQGCNLGMPPQLSNEVQKGVDIVVCPNCNRILYWENNL